MTSCLVLGAGLVGTYAARALADEAYVVAAYDVNPRPGYFQRFGPRQAVELRPLDILDQNAIYRAFKNFGPDVVINATGLLASTIGDDEQRAIAVNAEAARDIAHISAELGARKLIHISSLAVYDPTTQRPHEETDLLKPKSIYGRSKLMAEQYIREIASPNLQVTILRSAGVYGPIPYTSGSRTATFFDSLVCSQLSNDILPIQISIDALEEFLYIKDLAKSIALSVKNPGTDPIRILNVGTGSVEDITEVISAIQSLNSKIRIEVQDKGSSIRMPLNVEKSKVSIGFMAEYNLQSGLVDHAREYQR